MKFESIPPDHDTMIVQWRAERCSVSVWAYTYGQRRIIVMADYPPTGFWPVGDQF